MPVSFLDICQRIPIFATMFHKRHSSIWQKSVVNALLLFLLLTSLLPRQWLHELTADHAHVYSQVINKDYPQVSADNVRCQCVPIIHHQLPYDRPLEQSFRILFTTISEFSCKEYQHVPSIPKYFFSLHAPPAV